MTASGGDWGITAVSLRSPTARDQLAPQGGAFTSITLGPDGRKTRVIGAIAQVLVAPEDPSAVLDILADEIRWGSAADGKPGMDFAKTRASKDEVAGYFRDLVNEWSMEIFHVNEMVAEGGRVVVLCECAWTNKRGRPAPPSR